jgi:hypothetical protein
MNNTTNNKINTINTNNNIINIFHVVTVKQLTLQQTVARLHR